MHATLGPLDVDIVKSNSTVWAGVGSATYGDVVVGISLVAFGKAHVLTWRPKVDRIHRADVARHIKTAAREQLDAQRVGDADRIASAQRSMAYAQLCAV